jgi:hypothetical protein
MKITVEVDLKDFYSEEDGVSFSNQIKDFISYDVKAKVLADWKAKIGEEFNKAIVIEVEKHKQSLITDTFTELVVNAKVKKRYSSGEMCSITEWMTEELERTQLDGSKLKEFLTAQTTRASDTISKTLKERYDMLFASQIVAKLHENGMLKDDVAKLLLKE